MSSEKRECERLARIAQNRLDAAPVIEALRDRGLAIDSVADLFNMKMNYRRAVPVLIEWLPVVTNDDVKSDIVRALSVEWAKGTAAPKLLVTEFEEAEDRTGTGLRWTIGNALELLANDSIADRMLSFATDRRYGAARQMIVLGLAKLKGTRVVDVLLSLLTDDEVAGHAVIALGSLRVKRARSRIEPLLKHPKPWIRKEAKRALTKIDKGGRTV